MLNAQEVKAKLTNVHIIHIVERLGAKIFYQNDNHIIMNTICHNISGGSNKLYYYKESQTFYCYSGEDKGCGGSFDIIELVCRNKQYKLRQAIDWICILLNFDTIEYGFGQNNNNLINDWSFISSLPLKKKKIITKEKQDYYDKNILNIFQPIYYQGWIDEGISINSMIKHGIKYSTLQQKIIIPHYSIDNELMGVRCRAMLDEDLIYGKYTPLSIGKVTYSHPLSQNLYGLNINKNNIIQKKKIMLVEAEKSVLQCDTMFGNENFTVALCGKNLSVFQRDLILSLGVDEVIIGLDKQFKNLEDEEADNWAKFIRKKIINLLAPYVRVSVLWDSFNLLNYKDSPSDRGKDVLLKLMDKKIYTGTV